MVNPSYNKAFEIIKYVLENREFTQYRIHKDLNAHLFSTNRVVKWLIERNHAIHRDKKYFLQHPLELIVDISVFRRMKELKTAEFSTCLNKEEVMKLIGKQGIYCLESALSIYGGYWRSNRVCIYADKKLAEKLSEKLFHKPGDKTKVELFKEKPPVKPVKINGLLYTDKIRTTIDLVCDGLINAVERLADDIWGKEL